MLSDDDLTHLASHFKIKLMNDSVDYKMNSIYLSLSFSIHRMSTLIKDAVAKCFGVIYRRTSDRFMCLLILDTFALLL